MTEYTLIQLRKEKTSDSIYVTNNSNRDGEPAGEVLFVVRVGDESVSIKVERTWIPIDLSEYAPKSAILNSPQFLRAVNQRLLRLVPPDEAEETLGRGDAQVEYDRLRILRGNSDPLTLGDRKKKQAEASLSIQQQIEQETAARKLAEGSGFETGVSAQVLAIMNREGFGAKEKMAALRNVEDDLTESDVHYVFTKASVDEISLKDWAKERLDVFKSNR